MACAWQFVHHYTIIVVDFSMSKISAIATRCMFYIRNNIGGTIAGYTRSGWPIPVPKFTISDRIPSKESHGLVDIRTTALIDEMKSHQKTSLKLRSASEDPYNCVGMIFCSRKVSVDIEHIYDILRNDGYNIIMREQVVAGDVVLYTLQREPAHVGLVSCVSVENRRIIGLQVLSKWGKGGEVEHDYREVPVHCGIPTAYYSTRKNHDAE